MTQLDERTRLQDRAAATGGEKGGHAGPIVRTAAALFSSQGVTWIASLIAVLVVPRFLGARSLGLLVTAHSLSRVSNAFSAFGTQRYVVKEVAREPDQVRAIVSTAIAIRLVIWLLIASVLLPIVWAVEGGGIFLALVVGTQLVAALQMTRSAMMGGLQARHTLGWAALWVAAVTLALHGLIAVALINGAGVAFVVYAELASWVISACGVAVIFWKKTVGPLGRSRALVRQVLIGGAPFLAMDLAMVVLGATDVMMLAAMASATAVGWYSFAFRLTSIPIFVQTVVSSAVFPSLSASARRDPALFKTVLTQALRVIVIGTFPAAFGLALLAGDLADLIAGGADFSKSAPLIVILATTVPLVASDTVLGVALFSLDRQRAWAVVIWGAVVLNATLNLVTIPAADAIFENAALGAVLSAAIAELFMAAWAWTLIRHHVHRGLLATTLYRAAVACAIMALAVLLAREWVGAIAAIPVGAVTYGLAALALRLVTADDLKLIRSSLARGRPVAEAAGTVDLPPAEPRETEPGGGRNGSS